MGDENNASESSVIDRNLSLSAEIALSNDDSSKDDSDHLPE